MSVDADLRRDVIERPILDEIDLSGWDIRKALLLFAKSNPPLLEWLASPLVYKDTQTLAPKLKAFLPDYYAPNASLYHYLHMAQGNFKDYLRGDIVWVKKYFYVLRPLLAVRWIEQGRGPVPMPFTDVLVTIADKPELVDEIETLRKRKMAGEELDRGPAIPIITDFVSSELARLEQLHPERKVQMKNHHDIRRMKRPPTHPGEMLLEDFLKPLGMSRAAAARKMRISSSRLNALIREKRRVTAQTALRLADFLHTSPEFWLNLQMSWDLWHAYRAEGRTKKARLEKKGWKFGSAATFLGLSRDEENRLDIEVARKRLADPKEVPIPYERVRKELGLD